MAVAVVAFPPTALPDAADHSRVSYRYGDTDLKPLDGFCAYHEGHYHTGDSDASNPRRFCSKICEDNHGHWAT